MKFLATILLSVSLIGNAMGCAEDGSSGILPKNNMKIPVGIKGSTGGLTEAQFNSVIDKVEEVYAPIVSQFGGKLEVLRNWTDPTVNAYAEQIGTSWRVAMFGGLARHEAVTEDGFALVVCHELGHHIGGAPKKGFRWASNEGQADYFATLKCLRRVWNFDNNIEIVSKMTDVPKSLVEACGRKHVWNVDVAMCVRGGMAGMSVSKMFQSFAPGSPEPRFETPDRHVVTLTDDSHPDYQCRLDTFLQGALCEKSFNEDVSQSDEVKGTCHSLAGHRDGLRPTCWFKPRQ